MDGWEKGYKHKKERLTGKEVGRKRGGRKWGKGQVYRRRKRTKVRKGE